ncbi:MAG: MFS transporter, partial [Nitrososphaerales archaeon]
IYNMVGRFTGSAGALFSVFPSLMQTYFHLEIVDSYRPIFITYTVVAIATAIIYSLLSNQVEIVTSIEKKSESTERSKLSPRSRSIITKLSFLIGIDSFAGGFVLQSIISYWFYTRYGVPLSELSVIFFTTGVLSAVAFIFAGRLADRIGAINTMVFTHIPSSIFLILVPLAPSFVLSLTLYLVRQPLSLMDVPARQSYVVSVVHPSERTLAAGMSNLARNSAQWISPSLSGLLMQFVSLSVPFLVCGTLKIAYDLSLYFNFKKIKESDIESKF